VQRYKNFRHIAYDAENFVFSAKRLYEAKNGQILQKRFSSSMQEKKKPHRREGAFHGV